MVIYASFRRKRPEAAAQMKKFERICKKFLTNGSACAKLTELPAGAAREENPIKKVRKNLKKVLDKRF